MTTIMAAMSAAPASTTATTLTPPSSSHGNGYSWNSSTGPENPSQARKTNGNNDFTNGYPRSPMLPSKRNSAVFNSNNNIDVGTGEDSHANMKGSGLLSPPYGNSAGPGAVKDATSPTDSLPDGSNKNGAGGDSNKRTNGDLYGANPDDVSSKWIHRDKLARIENEELQAAGIVLPKGRARSKPRGDPNSERNGIRRPGDTDGQIQPRSRKNSMAVSEPRTPDVVIPSWDLRLPDEIMSDPDPYFTSSGGGKGGSRIPVAKLSPVPIATEHLERDTRMARTPGAEDSFSYPKTRSRSGSMKALENTPLGKTPQPGKRSVTDVSPKKNAAGTRKVSAPAKAGAAGRPKTRNGASSKDSTSSSGGQTRPTTRSGERDLSLGAMSKQPEGDPPWMISAYRPDPRLPPDQQLLPTVARRLQQEQWEREGKFGSIYDTEFRPLTDDGFLEPPPERPQKSPVKELEKTEEWPLRTDSRSLTPGLLQKERTGSYSTIPKIQEKPLMSPLPSPRGPIPHTQDFAPVRVQDLEEEEEEEQRKKGCGCCVVM